MDKRITIGLAVLLIAVASMSVGYAYVAYTSNTHNSADVEYLIITPTSDGSEKVWTGSFTKEVGLNTTTSSEGVEYSVDGDIIDGHEYGPLGKIYLTVDEQRSSDDYTISTSVINGEGLNITEYTYYVLYQIGSAETAEDAQTAAEADTGTLVQLSLSSTDYVAESGTIENADENNYTVILTTIYVALKEGDSVLKPYGTYIGTTVLDDVSFQFAAKIVTA